ncbi:hypothetical protein K7X08_030573 [Anisodus acutangulus]|uniref:Uncharacterized protein n=1 Tax=Anisodus acutangulus TaxID=402998 RepID=A0A9Q1MRP6_9SOLA|nr:hypothetical protein K7X08_030573 [Anisodus acutangulus]
MEAIQEDIGEGILQCTNHTYKNTTTPGGICAFCLQEKLGMLVSSSTTASTLSMQTNNINSTNNYDYHHFDKMRKPRNVKSVETFTPGHVHMLEADKVQDHSHKRKGFWSFLHYSSFKHSSRAKKTEKPIQVYSRSRSVGCGSSRSFSGDFIEKISTGLDGCTLRRIESQRESKHIVSSSSSYIEENGNGKSTIKGIKSWGWFLASPMRALSKKRESLKKNATANLDAIPSLLIVRN